MNPLELAKSIAVEASKAKAIHPLILDLRKISSVADYFVIASGSSDRQTRAICDRAVEELKKQNRRPLSVEGYEQGKWVLVDFGDVVLHVFLEDWRRLYDLEGFWQRAPRVRLRAKAKPKTRRKVASPSKSKKSRKK